MHLRRLRVHGSTDYVNPKLHGLSNTPEWRAWDGMKKRCRGLRPGDDRHYRSRGVRVCPQWESSFQAFLDHVGPRPSAKHSIDRWPNRDGDYEPGNVRWATASQQNRNLRSTKLTDTDVKFIRHWASRGHLQKDIAKAFKLSAPFVSRVIREERWG